MTLGHFSLSSPFLNPARGHPFLFFLDQKNAAVTLVSASGGVFLSLSSYGAEKALPRKPSQAIRPWVRYHLTWQAEERESARSRLLWFPVWPGFVSVVYRTWAAVTDLEIRMYKTTFALLEYRVFSMNKTDIEEERAFVPTVSRRSTWI